MTATMKNNAILSVLTRSLRLPVLLFWGAGFFLGCADTGTQPQRETVCRPYTMVGYSLMQSCDDPELITMRLRSADCAYIVRCEWRELYVYGGEIMICEEE